MIRQSPLMRARAKDLRRGPTNAEALLWELLADKGLGVRVRRQKVLENQIIVDFYVPRWKLVIEIDGSAHENEWAATRDRERDAWLDSLGFSVLRFTNDEIMRNVRSVYRRIISFQADKDIAASIAAPPDLAGTKGRHLKPPR